MVSGFPEKLPQPPLSGSPLRFQETKLAGAFLIDIERLEDARGFFARTFSRDLFEQQGIHSTFVQSNVSFNPWKGTLRGLHYQAAPHAEAKLVRCTQGAVFDVIVDLRSESSTGHQWVGVELTAENHRMLYVPEGFAHGYVTLEAHSEVFYEVTEYHHPESAGGVRWNDPALGIVWPRNPTLLSERDRSLPLLTGGP
jgi:dTDP-4-dehydrorhamnose 3,5-epimerase